MNEKISLARQIQDFANQRGGSHATREARALTARDFSNSMREHNHQIHTVKSIKVRHLTLYAQILQDRNLSKRTIANRLSHLRAALISAGKEQMLKMKEISNKSLNARGGSRIGTHKPMPGDKYQQFLKSLRERNLSSAIILELQRALGLRQQEALKGATTENLRAWERQLAHGYANVNKGTKGGRQRETLVKSIKRAQEAVKIALEHAKKNGGYVLDAKDYKTALDRLKNDYRAVGMKAEYSSHSLRYAWAQEQYKYYLESGLTQSEARKELSQDLGHGDGRGRYIAMVYLRK